MTACFCALLIGLIVYKLNLKTFSSERSVIFDAIDFKNE